MKIKEVIDKELADQLNQVNVIGLDIGSRTAKGILLANGKIHTVIFPTGLYMQDTADDLINRLLKKAKLERFDISYIVGTGYGRISMEFADIPHQIVTEISCHAMGAHYLNPKTQTIIDIGGQDSKAIKINTKSGKVIEFVMNDKCAAGTGRFLEKIAQLLDLTIDELGQEALKSKNPSVISSQCVVFAESEVISLRAKGESRQDIAAGIHHAVARRVRNLLNRIGLEPALVFSGGVSKNIGMKKALEELLEYSFSDTKMDMVYAGALGAAIYAHKYSRTSPVVFKKEGLDIGLDLAGFKKHIEQRKQAFANKSNNGQKRVGYFCAYTPLELLSAAGVDHIRLFKAGDSDVVASGELLTQSVFCDFTKSCIGAFREGDGLYNSLDKLYTFYTCDSIKMIAEAINDRYMPTEIFILPKLRDKETSRLFFQKELMNFKKDLEKLTGRKIPTEKIREQIVLYNQIRKYLLKISELRKHPNPPLTGKDFLDLVTGYYYLPPEELLPLYQNIYKQLLELPDSGQKKIRLMMAGGIVADGDGRLLQIVENEIGAKIVIEEHCTGVRPFYNIINEDSDEPLEALAHGYLNQAPCSRMKPLEDWAQFNGQLAQDYQVDGVIFYYLKFCPCYGLPKNYLFRYFQELGLPVLEIQSDYSASDQGQLKTRIEAFVEVLGEKRGGRNGDNNKGIAKSAGLHQV